MRDDAGRDLNLAERDLVDETPVGHGRFLHVAQQQEPRCPVAGAGRGPDCDASRRHDEESDKAEKIFLLDRSVILKPSFECLARGGPFPLTFYAQNPSPHARFARGFGWQSLRVLGKPVADANRDNHERGSRNRRDEANRLRLAGLSTLHPHQVRTGKTPAVGSDERLAIDLLNDEALARAIACQHNDRVAGLHRPGGGSPGTTG